MGVLKRFKGKKRRMVMKYIRKKRKSGPLHFTLIDPDKQAPAKAARLACEAEKAGSDAIMIGGSQAAQAIYQDDTIQEIKKRSGLPVILFPSSHAGISGYADAVFFMSLLNSRSTQYMMEEQVKGSVIISKYKLEALPMGYLIVESGNTTSAAWVGDVRPIPREKPEFAVAYALAAKYFGMKFVYLEAGSGADHPVPNGMVSVVKKAVSNGKNGCYVIVGGGIRDEKSAREKAAAGADIIVTGTIGEKNPEMLKRIIRAVEKR
jgi:phosphoglycerol geranylgeranyltransferase